MPFSNKTIFFALVSLGASYLFSCSKKDTPASGAVYTLKYADSVLYLRNQASDYIVYPTEQGPGHYSGYPEGIEIDEKTGAINVNKSETGLRYRVTYTSPAGDTSSVKVVISGINFTDKFYVLAAGDSIASPVYNASLSRVLPLSGSVFDEGNIANSGGCSVKTSNGKLNLAETVRNGVFGTVPANDSRRDFEIIYRLNDGSNKAVNKLKVRLYYYAHMSDVAPDLIQTLNDRQQGGVFIGGNFTAVPSFTNQTAKPRPPCVIIIAG